MTQKERELLAQALERYGGRNQIVKAMEEMAEAIRALSKVYHEEAEAVPVNEMILRRMNLAEELADVGIMIDQVKLLLPDVDCMISLYRKAKMRRLEQRMEEADKAAAPGADARTTHTEQEGAGAQAHEASR